MHFSIYEMYVSSQKEGDSRETSRRFCEKQARFVETFGMVYETPRFIEMYG